MVGKQALLSCIKYCRKTEASDNTFQSPREALENFGLKRHLIGNSVVKASDGSLQLFSDLKSHIGTNLK